MKGMLAVLGFVLLTAFCWGIYGPVLHEGQHAMGAEVDGRHVNSLLRPFICVGLAYFVIAVIVPTFVLLFRGETGGWSGSGALWSLVAGGLGALGALGIILAFKNHGNPIYVMPLVFGGAPVINTFLTMFMAGSYKHTGPLFYAGLILVVSGAVTVLVFKPPAPRALAVTPVHAPASGASPAIAPDSAAQPSELRAAADLALVTFWVVVTALCWGAYGPVLHKGQAAMAGSRLRPFLCVGLAYFLIAVLVPLLLLVRFPEPGSFANLVGTAWSLAAGAAGALGALGIIMAFNFGGKPIYVMPLVFGGAPVINTFTSILAKGSFASASPLFYAGLIIVGVGAVTVLVFAPRPGKKPATRPAPQPASA